ncbi:MAG: N-6 DNA methylase [Elusimicrobiota bacterium]
MSNSEFEEYFLDSIEIIKKVVDKTEYRDFLVPILFFKSLNDTYLDEYEKALKKYKIEKIARDPAYHRFQLPKGYLWEDLQRKTENVDQFLNTIFEKIEKANPDKLTGAFKFDYIEANIDDAIFIELINHLSTKNLSLEKNDEDEMGIAFMKLIEYFSRKEDRNPGEFSTPREIIQIMVRILSPFKNGDSFHDPACGSGDMLVETARYYKNEQEGDPSKLRLTGQVNIKNIPILAKINLYFNRQNADIKKGSPFTEPQFLENDDLEKFDYVITNFPFSEDWAKDEMKDDHFKRFGWAEKLPSKSRADYAYIMHMVKQLKENGKMISVVPQGVLFRKDENKFRKPMIENDLVEAVITLPQKLFGEDTGIAPAILLINKDKPEERQNKIIFIYAGDEKFYREFSNLNQLTEEGILHVVNNYKNWESEEKVSRVVDLEEIQDNDYNLNVALYVDTTVPEEDIDVKEELQIIHRLEKEQSEIKNQLYEYMEGLGYE